MIYVKKSDETKIQKEVKKFYEKIFNERALYNKKGKIKYFMGYDGNPVKATDDNIIDETLDELVDYFANDTDVYSNVSVEDTSGVIVMYAYEYVENELK